MDDDSRQTLARLIRAQRVAALGTLRDGAPLVSMVLFAAAADFSEFYIHTSRLAHHTQDMLRDPRAGLMIAETDDGRRDPQTLARVSVTGEAARLPPEDPDYEAAKAAYLVKHPQTAFTFGFADFDLYRIRPASARYVAGFAKAFNLTPASLRKAAKDATEM
jgi:putative heme iron utilization protein